VAFLTKQIITIVGSQIEMEKVFSLVGGIDSFCSNVTCKWKTWRESSQLLKFGLAINMLIVFQLSYFSFLFNKK